MILCLLSLGACQDSPLTPAREERFTSTSRVVKAKGNSPKLGPTLNAAPEKKRSEVTQAFPEQKAKVPIIDYRSKIKVNLTRHCEIPSSPGGRFSQAREMQYNSMLDLLRKEFPDHFVGGIPSGRGGTLRFLFEPDFLDYRRVQKRLKGARFPTELRPVCKGKQERDRRLKAVKQFVKEQDHFAQVHYYYSELATSRVYLMIIPGSFGLRALLYQGLGDSVRVGEAKRVR